MLRFGNRNFLTTVKYWCKDSMTIDTSSSDISLVACIRVIKDLQFFSFVNLISFSVTGLEGYAAEVQGSSTVREIELRTVEHSGLA